MTILFRFLIVDDEKIVVDSISYIIKNNFKDVVYDTARSGREAIEKADLFRPDIVLMDIRMPGINGIDAIKEIKLKLPETLFVVISAYEQFEFAKEALTLGVIDYILKPMNKNILMETIKKSLSILIKEREKKSKEIATIEKYETTLPLIEQNLLYSIMIGNKTFNLTEDYKHLLSIDRPGGYFITIELKNKHSKEINSSIYNNIRDLIKYKCKCLIGPMILNRILILVISEEDRELVYEESINLANYIAKKLYHLDSNIDSKIGIGSYKNLNDIEISYSESLKALYNSEDNICHINNISSTLFQSIDFPTEAEKKLIEFCILGETEESLGYLHTIFIWFQGSFGHNLDNYKTAVIELIVIIHKNLLEHNIHSTHDNNYISEILNLNNFNELETWCRDKISSICDTTKKLQKKNLSKLVINAKKYIDVNFYNDITLEEISKEACVSPHYFSRLFKEETGENYIDYLTKVRINKAKELMHNTNISIKEICYKIGYNDPNYFSRLFKKIEKISPTDYLKNILVR